MITLSDRYGDLNIEDMEEFEGMEPDNEQPINLNSGAIFRPGEVRSFDEDFGDMLDETLAEMEATEPEWSDEFSSEIDAQEYFERKGIERETE